jgi:hypothetical protein
MKIRIKIDIKTNRPFVYLFLWIIITYHDIKRKLTGKYTIIYNHHLHAVEIYDNYDFEFPLYKFNIELPFTSNDNENIFIIKTIKINENILKTKDIDILNLYLKSLLL